MEYYSAIKKNEILPFVTALMDLEGMMLTEGSQISYDFTYTLNLKTKTNKPKRNNTKKRLMVDTETGENNVSVLPRWK